MNLDRVFVYVFRDTLLAGLLDGVRASGNRDVCVKTTPTKRGMLYADRALTRGGGEGMKVWYSYLWLQKICTASNFSEKFVSPFIFEKKNIAQDA